jgi:3-oxoacyl-(acyl-carrier-protein) synthase
VYAEVVGFGAAHSSPWYEDGEADEGYRFAIEAAISNAGISAAEVDAVVPLASGVEAMDQAESGALRAVFGDRLADVPLVTVTPNVGNCMAGIGGLQAAVAAKCLAEQRIPARLHGGTPREGLQVGGAPSRPATLRHVLVCTGSLGGQNAALVLRKAANM